MNLDLQPFFWKNAVRILDGTKYHGQVRPVLCEWENVRVVELADGSAYALLFNEWEKVVTGPFASPKPPQHRPISAPPLISRCPLCKETNTLDVSTRVFVCCDLQVEAVLARAILERL